MIGEYCGNTLPPSASTHGSLMLHFVTDSIIHYNGWKAEYDFEACGGLQTGESGTINGRTPTDDWSEHRNQNCTWQLTTDIGKVIELKFSFFDLEYHPVCGHDYLAVYDG